jgi:hypothetical protein
MSERLLIEGGITGSAQEGSFMNATLQAVGPIKDDEGKYVDPVLDMSIAVHVAVPEPFARDEADLHRYLRDLFGRLVREHPNIEIQIQTGPYGDGPEEDYEDDNDA